MTDRSDVPAVGSPVPREDGPEKVHGRARFCDDYRPPGLLHAGLLASPHAHARILGLDTAAARASPGVLGVFSGEDFPLRIGIYLGDKPPLAVGRVRHYGEPVAAVVASSPEAADQALPLLRVRYEPLPAVGSVREALAPGAPLLHEDMASYAHIPAILPEPGSNVAHRTRIRKGDAERAFAGAAVTVETEVSLPPGDHAAMEPRAAIAEIGPDGRVRVHSATQSPFVVRALLAQQLGIPDGLITVSASRVGGGFGGKAGIQLEALACLLSKALGGRPVRLANTRELDMASSPGRPGLEARVRLGADAEGRLVAADILFLFDSGAYADYAVNVSRAAGYSCTGPYRVPNVRADSLCVYTNRPFATAYRGFGHVELTLAVERAMDLLADRLGLDPLELRLRNAVRAGDTTPSGQVLDLSTGDLAGCLRAVGERLGWESGSRAQASAHTVRAKSVACFWKAPAVPPNTSSSAVLTLNPDGSANLITGVVEIGSGTATGLIQLAADELGIEPGRVHFVREVSTDRAPHDWTTAASRSLFMAGRAVLAAARDAVRQVRRTAAEALRVAEEDLAVRGGRVFLPGEPERGFGLGELALGYTYPNGNSIGGPAVGRGSCIARGLTGLDPDTGEGRPGLEWTLGAQGVEVEVDTRDGSYRVLRAASCMDVGRVINPQAARAQVAGAMAMGLGLARGEAFAFDERQRLLNGTLRDYKIPRFGDHPEYAVDFLETPQLDGPRGARGLGEQGVLGMPAALAGALSRAVGRPLNRLPLTPESVWRALAPEEGA